MLLFFFFGGLPNNTGNSSQEGCAFWFVTKSFVFTNDPTAGSPTVTLLRLLLPLNDQV